jgi:hypothetical protein
MPELPQPQLIFVMEKKKINVYGFQNVKIIGASG